jgi:hypothetical protein
MAERRAGGETGVEQVRWSGEVPASDLLQAALSRRVNAASGTSAIAPQTFRIRYRDGLQATLAHLDAETRDFLFAARIEGRAEPVSTCFYIELYVHNHWSFMVRNFEDLVLTHHNPIPIERTLMANGIMLAGLESRRLGGTWVDTPELNISYSPSR